MAANVGSTFLRIVLGAELARLRDQAGLTGEAAARHAGCSPTTISSVEQGKTGFRRIEHLARLTDAYGVDEEGQAWLMDMHRQSKGDDWWSTGLSTMPSGMNLFLAMESGAKTVDAWCPGVVNGLIQTKEYAHALISKAKFANDTTDAFVENAVEIRMTRQKRITEQGMKLNCVMDESALTNMVGSSKTLRDQFDYIIELMTKHPNVTVQIIPKAANTYRLTGGDFYILGFDPKQLPTPIVASGTVDGTTRVSSKERQANQFARRFEELVRGALPAHETPKFLQRLKKEV
ncbi:helix-turn-helix transcriptional regulator [Streptomyces sp. NPDC097619]|uniref:helix-turn-helix domain-containing protein n=1 Tax=Streptomyces sp. NPDC097619 TaxID=3157228 RepID=UPI003328B3A8